LTTVGRWLVGLGLTLAAVGALLWILGRLGLPAPGRLPGDLTFRGRNFVVWLPLGTSLLLSIVLSVLFHLISRLSRP
jgi:hypothetical protein